ncbi:MAG: GIY-YIG nuclease family protein [Balneolales bacterium]
MKTLSKSAISKVKQPNISLSNPWFTYIIRCTNGNLYTGSTNHMIRRWHQHREGTGAKYLWAHDPEV